MPLTKKGSKIMKAMKEEYGKGTIKNVHKGKKKKGR